MEMHTSSSELKKEAKELLSGKRKEAILLNSLPILLKLVGLIFSISFFIFLQTQSTLISDIRATYDPRYIFSANDVTLAIQMVSQSLYSFLVAGVLFTSLDWLRNPKLSIEPVKNTLQLFTKKYFSGIAIITFLTFIFTFLWTLLFIIPGTIKICSYSQAYFIFKDRKVVSGNKKVSGLDCITESRQIMNGHKQDYFVLILSFIGWEILSLLTLGIGYLWLVPYKNMTYAAFYKDLSNNKNFDNE